MGRDEGEEGVDRGEGVRCAVVGGAVCGGFMVVEVLGASARGIAELDLLEAVGLDQVVCDRALAGADS